MNLASNWRYHNARKLNVKLLVMLNRLILHISYASSGLKRAGIRFIADSLHPDISCACDQLSANLLWFSLLCWKWLWPTWSLSTLEWQSMASITAMSYSLSRQMLPAIKHVAGGTFVFQQHNASSHRAKNTIKLLQQEMPDFIGPDLWPLNNPDLSPVDYKVWGVVPQRVYECHMNSVDELKQCLVEVLNSLR